MQRKKCPGCGPRPLSAFQKNRAKADGLASECRDCKSIYDRARKFGISFEQYEALLEKQKGVCAICRKPERARRLAVDHDHATLRIRGLLCGHCNRALGFLRDKPLNILRAVVYLMEHNEEDATSSSD